MDIDIVLHITHYDDRSNSKSVSWSATVGSSWSSFATYIVRLSLLLLSILTAHAEALGGGKDWDGYLTTLNIFATNPAVAVFFASTVV